VGLGTAAELAAGLDGTRTRNLLHKLEKELLAIGGITINGDTQNRLPNTLNICIEGIKSEQLITRVPQLAMATGSACTSALPQPSHVLLAMGLTEEQAYSSIRLSIGRYTTEEEIKRTVELLSAAINKLRS
jgi:cysteine desulfurase